MALILNLYALFGIPNAIFLVLTMIVLGWIAYKIFNNLYQCGCAIVCFPTFSDRHNWIIEPSPSNKIYALLSIVTMTLYYILQIPVEFLLSIELNINYETVFEYDNIPLMFRAVGHTFYFLYLASTIEYQMMSEPLIENVISIKLIIFVKLLQWFSLSLTCVIIILWSISSSGNYYHGVPILLLIGIMLLIIRVVSEIILTWTYFRGLNNVCHWWYTKRWEEYEKYGETDKIHELLIIITRSTITVTVSFIVTIIAIISNCMVEYVVNVYASPIAVCLCTIFVSLLFCIDDITYGLSIYFIYEFGYNDYRKCCDKCHNYVYKYFKNKHQDQVINGKFQNNRYVSNRNKTFCQCCLSFKNEPVVTTEYSLLSNL